MALCEIRRGLKKIKKTPLTEFSGSAHERGGSVVEYWTHGRSIAGLSFTGGTALCP